MVIVATGYSLMTQDTNEKKLLKPVKFKSCERLVLVRRAYARVDPLIKRLNITIIGFRVLSVGAHQI